ncbi:DnaT-like ssDNA-binding domain-containing protein [Haliea sp. E17]|uniref:DnaT-like ssDNA-binding domain-containing protein n=1 Tax=Haliea sp. E17 TaxID=3401576 RepID=UPI003AAB387F
MESSLVPERQLVFSPGLAATIGLEEAILLQHLHGLFQHHPPQIRDNHAWLAVSREYLLGSLPFWSAVDLHRISRSLADQGVILIESPPLHSSERLLFALNEPVRQPARAVQRAPEAPPMRRSAALLPANWAPSEDLLQLLALNHNIPRQFALDQLEDFIFYWRERGESHHAWENKFRQHVTNNWRRRQQDERGGFQVTDPAPLDNQWRPSADALEIMQRGGIDREFIEEAIPEFILYWRERGAAPKELNTKFIQHIRIQWARYTAAVEHGSEPRPISDHWQPSRDVYDILHMSHIDLDFARSLLPEFIVYWKDSGQVHTSWNSKFLQHAKFHWAKRHQMQTAGNSNAGQQGSHSTGRTRDRSLEDDLSDTSWAN